MANSWFRLYAEFATDPKVQMLSEADQRRYIMLLCLRCSNVSVTLHDDEIAFQLRISNEEWEQTKLTLVSKKLINEDSKPCAWDKRQYASDSSTERVSRHREKMKRQCNVSVTPPDTDTDTDTDTEKNNTSSLRSDVKKTKTKINQTDLIAEGIPPQKAAEFLQLRKEKRMPLTVTAWNQMKHESGSIGWDVKQAVEKCLIQGWGGFRGEWVLNEQKNARASPKPMNKQEALEARNKAVGDEWLRKKMEEMNRESA